MVRSGTFDKNQKLYLASIATLKSLNEKCRSVTQGDLFRIEVLEKLVDQAYEKLSAIHEELVSESDELELEQLISDFGKQSEIYEDTKVQLITLMRSGKVDSKTRLESAMSAPVSDSPQINFPKFDGTFQQWASFSAHFTANIHNDESLTDLQRFDYLVSALNSPALKVISHLPVCAESYKEAWDKLETYFHRKRRTINAYLRKIIAHPQIKSNDDNSLRELIHLFDLTKCALDILEDPEQQFNTLWMCLLTEKLDKETRRSWELSLPDDATISGTEEVLSFLEQRARILAAKEEENRKSETTKEEMNQKSEAKKTIHMKKVKFFE